MTLETERIAGILKEMELTPRRRIGVVDLGSNSGRLVVYDQYGSGYLSIVEDGRVPLRLVNDLDQDGQLGGEATKRIIDALREFTSLAQGAGAERVVVVGTAALREAANGGPFLQSIRETVRAEIDILDGLAEALYSFLGAVYGLPVWNGYTLDIGGGSLELIRFKDRRPVSTWTLPLGALRTSRDFIKSDPPTSKELRNLKRHIAHALKENDIPAADPDDVLVGTGGTVRNIAKIDRKQRPSPISRLHGYSLPFQRVRHVVSHLTSVDAARRAATPGLNADRADSIVGGALTVQVVMGSLGMSELLVSGKGLREGIAFAMSSPDVPDPAAVKRSSIAALASRFGAWEAERAEQRLVALGHLKGALDSGDSSDFIELTEYAAFLLDIGRSVDYYNRLGHTATIVQAADLDGFTHREIALLCAIIREADQRNSDLSQFAPLVTPDDADRIARCGVLLLIADEIARRYPRNTNVNLRVDAQTDAVTISFPPFSEYGVAKLADRFQRIFGRQLIFT